MKEALPRLFKELGRIQTYKFFETFCIEYKTSGALDWGEADPFESHVDNDEEFVTHGPFGRIPFADYHVFLIKGTPEDIYDKLIRFKENEAFS